jgi:flagellar basal-body rod protein FlgF
MVSGKYSALSGAIAREQAISNISNNLANISTTGYRKSQVNFESILKGEQQSKEARGINYARVQQNYTNFTGGPLRQTDDPLNVAIEGDGFFKVQGPKGTLYTRRGDFMLNSEGLLMTHNKMPVLDQDNGQITIPDSDTSQVVIDDTGTIFLLGLQGSRSEIGKLGVVSVNDLQKLTKESDTTFSLAAGGAEQPSTNSTVTQGSLELANVSMSEELTQMIDSYRAFETYHKVLKSYETIAEIQDDLGTLS